tara:strand:+ start:21799 stop:22062 length:264 start_codon:yes stop_codon:yes gene_type:complete
MDGVVDNEHVIYLGRSVPKAHFRAWIYGHDGARMLARTWIQYEALLSTGLWYSKLEDVPEKLISEDTKTDLVSKDTNKSKSRKKDGD